MLVTCSHFDPTAALDSDSVTRWGVNRDFRESGERDQAEPPASGAAFVLVDLQAGFSEPSRRDRTNPEAEVRR